MINRGNNVLGISKVVCSIFLCLSSVVICADDNIVPNSCICEISERSNDQCKVVMLDQKEWIAINIGTKVNSVDFDTFVSSCAKEDARVIKKLYLSGYSPAVMLTWEVESQHYYRTHIKLTNIRRDILIEAKLQGKSYYMEARVFVKEKQRKLKGNCGRRLDSKLCKTLDDKYENILSTY